jgi:butyrate kinase
MTSHADFVFNILVVNPGSTSTKVALFKNEECVFIENISHPADEIGRYSRIADQYPMRISILETKLKNHGVAFESLHAIVGRGGLLRPVEGGTYHVNASMLDDLKKAERGEHASNLGGLMTHSLAEKTGIPSFIVDPVTVDELDDIARLSGLPQIRRRSIFHALNQKAVARTAAQKLGKPYQEINLIVAHLGGGISVGSHKKGRVVEVNNALDGDGPFAPERAGGLPSGQLAEMCFSGSYSAAEIKKLLTGRGGMVAHLGTNDLSEVKKRIAAGEAVSRLVFEAMAYQVAKQIGAMAAVLLGDVQAVVLTGGLAFDPDFVRFIAERVRWICEILVIPGEQEMLSLALGALRVLRKQESAKTY